MEKRERLKEQLQLFLQAKAAMFVNSSSVLQFPFYDKPVVSIIIILFNRVEYTYQCLETILAHADVPYEIILVNNGSIDQTEDLLRKVQNVTVLRNKENAGFLRACNQAARAARGEWILFLNNDTQVTPGMISSLVTTGDSWPDCGAVGGKLIFPDGRLQEAGSIIWQDGSCFGYGRDDDPYLPEYQYVKEVDFCSGACLLVKKTLFQQAGMFRSDYAPAYYEEADLCMKLRQMGYKVVFQPAAVAIHYEFGSSGSMDEAISLQVKNRETFVQHWSTQLQEHSPPAIENCLYAREHGPQKKYRILFIDDRIPVSELGSGFPRSFSILEKLANEGFHLTFFPLQIPEKVEPQTHLLQQKGIEVFFNRKQEKLDFARFYTARKDYYHTVWISRPHNMEEVAGVIKSINPGQRIVYDAEALYAAREILQQEMNGKKLSKREKEEKIHREIRIMSQADTIVTVSDLEKKTISRRGFHNVEVLGHVMEQRATSHRFDQRRDLLFVGGFLTSPSPNEDAIHYFVREVFPLVHRQTGAKLWIVGTNYLSSIKQLASENIFVTDRVGDLTGYYNRCRVFVVPTRYAAGISLKLVESMAHGLPAVTTPLIAKQLGCKRDVVLTGEDASAFAEKVVAAYTDKMLWEQLRTNGLKFVAKHFDPVTFHKRLLRLVRPKHDN